MFCNQQMHTTFDVLRLLTPFDINKDKVRIGKKGDGGYILVDDLMPDQAVLSFGIGNEVSFDLAMAERGHKTYMFDHTISGAPAQHKNLEFVRNGISGASKPRESVFSLADHLKRLDIGGENLILKMDVEGAEWESLAATPPAIFRRFQQIVIEVHNLHRLGDPLMRNVVAGVLRKLNMQFTLFHVHGNNFAQLNLVDGLPVLDLLELSYVRTSAIERQPSRTIFPTEFDYPNVPGRDCLLWFFPFMPCQIEPGELRKTAQRIEFQFGQQVSRPPSPNILSNVSNADLIDARNSYTGKTLLPITPGEISLDDMRNLLGTDAPVILDIGANDGTHTKIFLKLFPKATIYACEPDPRAVARFRANIVDPRVKLFEGAIGVHDGEAEFHVSSGFPPGITPEQKAHFPLGWDLSGSLRAPKKHQEIWPWCKFESTIKVPVLRLDTWADWNNVEKIDFIWADTQGAEGDIIVGGKMALARTRYFYTEYSNDEWYEGQPNLEQLIKMLENFVVLQRYQMDVLLMNTALQ
jgi:FkbM family methyltransferase